MRYAYIDVAVYRGEPAVQLTDDVGIAYAADDNALISSQCRTLKLHCVWFGSEFAPSNPDRRVVDRYKGRLRQVERSRTLPMQVGVRVLIQAVRSNALWRASQAGAIRTDGDLVLVDGGEDDALAERLADQRSALRYFAGVPRQSRRKSLHQRNRGKQRRVTAPPRQHEIGPVQYGLLEWLHTHHADDTAATVDDAVTDRRCRIEGEDSILMQEPLEISLVLLRVNYGCPQSQMMFGNDLACDLQSPIHVNIATRRTRRSNDYRDVCLSASPQHQREVALDSLPGKSGYSHS